MLSKTWMMAALSMTAFGSILTIFCLEENGKEYKVIKSGNNTRVEIDCHMNQIDSIKLPDLNEAHGNNNTNILIKDCLLPEESLQNIFLGLTKNAIVRLILVNVPLINRQHFDQVTLINDIIIINSNVTSDVFTGMSQWVRVELRNSRFSISDASFSDATDLKTLIIQQCNIAHLPPDTFRAHHYNLTLLDLSKNFITRVTNSFFERLSSLLELNLSYNLLTSLPDDFLRSIPSLEQLDLSFNPLLEISSNSMQGSNLNLLSVDGNTIPLSLGPKAFADMRRLHKIFLSNSSIKKLPEELYQGSNNIEIIDLSQNLIEELPEDIFANKSSLVALYLNNNQLRVLSAATFASLPSVQWLNLDNNYITELSRGTFSSMNSLVTLPIRNNRLRSVSPDSFPTSITALFLENNSLTTLETTLLPALRRLSLVNNSFSSVPPHWRDNLPALDGVGFGRNTFTMLTPADFAALPRNISSIVMNNNEIVSVDVDRNTSLPPHIWLAGAPLRCDCSMHRFAARLQEGASEVHDASCAEPAYLNGTRLIRVPLTDFVCHLESCPPSCTCLVVPEAKVLQVKCGEQLTADQLTELESIRQRHYSDLTDKTIIVTN